MHLDQKVTVTCTDNDSKSNGKIIRIFPNGIDEKFQILSLSLKRQSLILCWIHGWIRVYCENLIILFSNFR